MKLFFKLALLVLVLNACHSKNKVIPKHGLFLGNSITKRKLIENKWWGYWGMAASKKENDFVHIFESRLKDLNPSFTTTTGNIADWERNHETFDLSTLDEHFSQKPDFVVIRMGENVKNVSGFLTSTKKLIQYVETKAPGAKIYITGCFWESRKKDIIIRAASIVEGIPYISLGHLYTADNILKIGDKVFGDDGEIHQINDHDVSRHPSDAGHKAISDEIFNFIFVD